MPNNADNKIWISKDIILCTSEVISNNCYNINKVTLSDRLHDVKTDAQS